MKKNVTDYVPEFAKLEWSPENLYETDFTDDSRTYKWPRAGLQHDEENELISTLIAQAQAVAEDYCRVEFSDTAPEAGTMAACGSAT